MKKQKRLGQHLLISESIAKSIVGAAELTKKDTVLEIGTGKGILTPFLCKEAKKVISIESDKKLYLKSSLKFSKISNLNLKHGNGFKTNEKFTVFFSNLPFSQSRKAMEWLIEKRFSRAIVMVQKEFAEKLFVTGKKRRAVSVLVNYATDIQCFMSVNKSNFYPIPRVDSSVLKLKRKKTLNKKLIKTVNKLFSYKRKKLPNVLKQFGQYIESEKRIEDLTGDEIIKIAKQINQKQSV